MTRIAYGLYPQALPADSNATTRRDWLWQIYLVLIVVLLLWPDYAELKPGGLPNVSPVRLMRGLGIAAGLFFLFRDPARSEMFYRRVRENWGALIVLFAFYGFRVATIFVGHMEAQQLLFFVKYDFWSYLSMFFLTLLVVRDERDVRKVVQVLVVAAAVIGLLAVLEFRLKRNLFQGIITVSNDFLMGVLRDKTRDNVYRAESTFEHPIVLGQFFAMFLPCCWYVLRHGDTKWLRIIGGAAFVLGFVAIFTSGSRSALALAVPILVLMGMWEIWLWLKRSNNRPAQYLVMLQFPLLLGIFGMVLYYLKNIAAGTTQETRGSASVRMDMLYAGLHKIDSAMLMGHGVGEATNVVTFVGTAGVRTLDNYYLVMALESGLIGLGLNLLLWAFFYGRSLGFITDRNVDRSRIGVLLSLALLTHIAIMTIHALQSLTWLLMVLFALILILRERRRLAPGPELK
jgi:hypothetical protein